MKAIITTIVILLGTIGSVDAYPIDPRPLRKLIMESEFIIIGHVLEIQTVKNKKERDYPDVIARIRISEVLQGNISESVIEVPYNPYYICPAPARYEAGTDGTRAHTIHMRYRTESRHLRRKVLKCTRLGFWRCWISRQSAMVTRNFSLLWNGW
jgi:hypothetical protein